MNYSRFARIGRKLSAGDTLAFLADDDWFDLLLLPDRGDIC